MIQTKLLLQKTPKYSIAKQIENIFIEQSLYTSLDDLLKGDILRNGNVMCEHFKGLTNCLLERLQEFVIPAAICKSASPHNLQYLVFFYFKNLPQFNILAFRRDFYP